MTQTRRRLRQAAYQFGVLGMARYRVRRALTVAMFHRVMDPADPDFADADPTYTVSTRLFGELLEFFRDHYEVVNLTQVLNSAEHNVGLPDYSLLITFDDGWADNLRYAAPLLESHGLPAVIFAAGEPIFSSADIWWQEQVFGAARRGRLGAALNGAILGDPLATSGGNSCDPLELVCHLGSLGEPERNSVLKAIPASTPVSRMMLMPDDLRTLSRLKIAIGIHGYSHLPLTRVANLDAELRRARSMIASASGDTASAAVLAFPHGVYDDRVLKTARDVGIRLVFSSIPILNQTESGMIEADRPLGRISVEAAQVTRGSGRLDASAAAAWLWRRPAPQLPSA